MAVRQRIEAALGVAMVAALIGVAWFFVEFGYLPPPFFHDIDDTFMDWYNTVFWGFQGGTYSNWLSIYPPLSFVLLNLVSNRACYEISPDFGRACDPSGVVVLVLFFVLNLFILLKIYTKADRRTAMARTIAVGLGMPMLFALERGNLVLPCFTVFILGHGRLLRSAWQRWLCFALSVNFKPYLVLPIVADVIRGRWRAAEGCMVACLLVYLVSFIIIGKGTPMEFIINSIGFEGKPIALSINGVEYSSNFVPALDLLQTILPIMHFMGSRPMELMEFWIPLLTRLGEMGVVLCFAAALWRPSALTGHRLATLSMTLVIILINPGGYSQIFLIFLVFLERWEGAALGTAILAAYGLCLPADFEFLTISQPIKQGYLSQRTVIYDLGLTVGEFVRPGLILLIQYALVAASLRDLWKAGPARAGLATARRRAIFAGRTRASVTNRPPRASTTAGLSPKGPPGLRPWG